jgi:hypothetical protein
MHFALPFMIPDAVAGDPPDGSALQVQIGALRYYKRHHSVCRKNEVIVKNCKAIVPAGILP